MKGLFRFITVVMCLVLLTGCGRQEAAADQPAAPLKTIPTATEIPDIQPATQPVQTLPPVTEPPATQPVQTLPPVTEPPVTQPEEPQPPVFCLPGVEAVDVVLYFNEVCLNAEYINSGDPTALQKWTDPICYYIDGNPTTEDLETVHGFEQWLNGIEGFPGMSETGNPTEANLQIIFCSQPELVDRMGSHFWDADGAVTFWYSNNEIYDAMICIRTDLDQTLRNSVILEEIYNGLGPIQDTALRPDSIIYAGFSQPQELTAMDELILRLLYHPAMVCGMDALQCGEIIRLLYY